MNAFLRFADWYNAALTDRLNRIYEALLIRSFALIVSAVLLGGFVVLPIAGALGWLP